MLFLPQSTIHPMRWNVMTRRDGAAIKFKAVA
jgi:hypothetical protein